MRSAPADKEIDPWGNSRLREHLNRLWFGDPAGQPPTADAEKTASSPADSGGPEDAYAAVHESANLHVPDDIPSVPGDEIELAPHQRQETAADVAAIDVDLALAEAPV